MFGPFLASAWLSRLSFVTGRADGTTMDQRRHVRSLVALVGSQIMLFTAVTGVLGRDASDSASETVRIEAIEGEEASDVADGEPLAALPTNHGRLDLVDYVPLRPGPIPSTARASASTSVPTTQPQTSVQTANSSPSTTATTAMPSTAPTTTEPATGPSSTTTTAALVEDPAVDAASTDDRPTTTGAPGVGDGLASAGGTKPTAGARAGTETTATRSGDEATTGSTTKPTTGRSAESTSTTSTTTTTTSTPPGSDSSTVPATNRTTTTTSITTTTTTRGTTTVTRASRPTTTSGSTTATTRTSRTTGSTTGATSSSVTTSTTRATTTTAMPTTRVTTTRPPPTDDPTNAGLEALRNRDSRFSRYATVPSDELSLSALTEPALVRDNGTVGDGQFRAACQYSHFAYDDPIVFPNQPGRSHLHMFFGNTRVHAGTTTPSLVNSGGGTCNGFELNRSGYWTPALLDGRGNAVVPEMIILYYKTKQPERVQPMPQGLKMIAGNAAAESFTASQALFWSCGDSGGAYNVGNRIPDCGGDTFNATIVFPQCWDGRNLDSADHRSHMALVSPHVDCPSSHPVRLPQISILFYFAGRQSVDGWHLSSDRSGGFNTGPGATLHADWWGGWNDDAMDLWVDGCMKAARNCSFGQTGTDRVLAKLNAFQNYPGPDVLPLP